MNCNKKDELLKILNDKMADTKHPLHVTKLSERLFDELRFLHNLGEKEKEYLLYAAMLHDIGLIISVKGHHRHSMQMIMDSEITGKNIEEKRIIANIARYHRKSLPSFKHEMFKELSEDDQKIVSVLASILRIADGLDRTHLSLVKDINVNTDKNTVVITYLSERRFIPEEEAAIKKSDLFENVFKKKAVIVWARL